MFFLFVNGAYCLEKFDTTPYDRLNSFTSTLWCWMSYTLIIYTQYTKVTDEKTFFIGS